MDKEMSEVGRQNLIGRDAEIQLIVHDLDLRQKLGQKIPELPKIKCRLIRRVLTWTWNYIAELKEPLFLDIEHFPEKARAKRTAYYVWVCPSYSYKDNKQDNIYLQLIETGKIDVNVSYLDHPEDVPNEMKVGLELDSFVDMSPNIGGGVMTIVK